LAADDPQSYLYGVDGDSLFIGKNAFGIDVALSFERLLTD